MPSIHPSNTPSEWNHGKEEKNTNGQTEHIHSYAVYFPFRCAHVLHESLHTHAGDTMCVRGSCPPLVCVCLSNGVTSIFEMEYKTGHRLIISPTWTMHAQHFYVQKCVHAHTVRVRAVRRIVRICVSSIPYIIHLCSNFIYGYCCWSLPPLRLPPFGVYHFVPFIFVSFCHFHSYGVRFIYKTSLEKIIQTNARFIVLPFPSCPHRGCCVRRTHTHTLARSIPAIKYSKSKNV